MIYIKELFNAHSVTEDKNQSNLSALVIDNAIGSSDLDYQATDKFLFLSSALVILLTSYNQS